MKLPKSFTRPHAPCDAAARATLHRDASRVLRRVAGDLSLRQRDFTIQARRQHRHKVEVFSLQTDSLCFEIAHAADRSTAKVSFRTCKGRDDLSGGRDNMVPLNAIGSPEGYADLLTTLRVVAGRRG